MTYYYRNYGSIKNEIAAQYSPEYSIIKNKDYSN